MNAPKDNATPSAAGRHRMDLTTGPIGRLLLKFALPILAGNALHVLYNIVDTFFVGRLSDGAGAVAATTLSFSPFFVLISVGSALTIGTSILVAQYTGAARHDMVQKVVYNSIFFVAISGIALSVFGVVAAGSICRLLGAPARIFDDAKSYMQIIFSGIAPMFLLFTLSAILRGIGDSKSGLRFMATATVTNIILDYLLIFGKGPFPRLQVAGAAGATVLAQLITITVGMIYVKKGNTGISLDWKGFRPDMEIMKKILKLGIPGGLSQLVVSISIVFLNAMIARLGTVPLAAFGIGSRLNSLAIMFGLAMSTATSSMVGQNMGAGKIGRARKSAFTAAGYLSIVMAVLTVILLAFPESVIRIVTTDNSVMEDGTAFLRIVGSTYVLVGIRFVIGGVLMGAGDMMMNLLFAFIWLWVIRVPVAWGLAFAAGMGAKGVFWGLAAGNIAGGAGMILYFFFGPWHKRKIIHH